MSVERAIKNAASSVEAEGYHIDEQAKELCRKFLNKEISWSQYVAQIKNKAGVA